MNGTKEDELEPLRDAPATPAPHANAGELHDRCENERETMSPRETADCAGMEIAELFENEEDGGS